MIVCRRGAEDAERVRVVSGIDLTLCVLCASAAEIHNVRHSKTVLSTLYPQW